MKNPFEHIPLAIVMTIISVATAWGVVQTKVATLEKTADKNEASMESIKDFKAEQRIVNENMKENITEVKSDLKEILKEIRSLR